MQVSHRFAVSSAVFDDAHLVSCAGLVPVMTLADQTGLSQLLADKIRFTCERIRSAAAHPSPKLTTLIAVYKSTGGGWGLPDVVASRSTPQKTTE